VGAADNFGEERKTMTVAFCVLGIQGSPHGARSSRAVRNVDLPDRFSNIMLIGSFITSPCGDPVRDPRPELKIQLHNPVYNEILRSRYW
jgi:hypothetical protein